MHKMTDPANTDLLPDGDVSGSFSMVRRPKEPVVVKFFDLNGTIDNGEYCMRELIWRHILMNTGNVIHDGFYYSAMTYAPDGRPTGHAELYTAREKLEEIIGPFEAIDWAERWDSNQPDGWYGRGNQFVHQWLLHHGRIPANSPFMDYETVERFIVSRFEQEILGGKLERRPGITEMFNYAAARNEPRVVVTNDPPELVDIKYKALKLNDDSPEIMDAGSILFTTTPADVDGAKKPDPSMLIFAIRKVSRMLGGVPIIADVIGDSVTDHESARAASLILKAEGHSIRQIIHYPYKSNDPVSPNATYRFKSVAPSDDLFNPAHLMAQVRGLESLGLLVPGTADVFPSSLIPRHM